jgi:hypothetical protein
MCRTESHVRQLWLQGFAPDVIARKLRIPVIEVCAILEELD